MVTAIKLATEMENAFSRNFYNVEVADEVKQQLENVADMWIKNYFKEEN